jgi:phage portal protein BeeE
MGLFRRLKLAMRAADEQKSFIQPPFWSPDHPLNQPIFAEGLLDNRERIEADFESYVSGAFKKSPPVFACISTRSAVLSEARFMYRKFEEGRPTDLFDGKGLELLARPWPGGTTGELIARMEQDASLAGNFFATTCDDLGRYGKASKGGPNRRIVRMRPDWVSIIVGSPRENGHPLDLDARILAYIYEPRGNMLHGQSGRTPERVVLMPEETCHYSPEPDPIARYRGMSWLTPVIKEISADIAAAMHKDQFYGNAAVPNLAIKFDKDTSQDAFEMFVEKFKSEHQGVWNAYKTLFLMGGADVEALTMDFRNLDFANIVGKGENRIANAAGVPSAWVGFSEGMQGSSLNAGNLTSLRRRFADGTIRPLWRKMAASLEVLAEPGEGEQLWFDERGVAFLREDATDLAEIMQTTMIGLDAGIRAGYKPDALVEAFRDNDVSKLLGQHSGRFSVQLWPDGQGPEQTGALGPASKPPGDGDKPKPDKPAPKPTDSGKGGK